MITATSHAVDINVLYTRVVNVGKWPRNHIATFDRNRRKIRDRGQGTKYIKKTNNSPANVSGYSGN